MRISLSLISFFIVIALGSVSVSAQTKPKQYVAKVYTLDRKAVQGILQSADNQGIFIIRKTGDTTTFINALQIRQIKLRKKGKAGRGTAIGFFSGLAIGAGTAIALHSDDKLNNSLFSVGAVLFTFATTAVGGAIASRPEDIILLNGNANEYAMALQKLQSYSLIAK